MPPTSFPPVRKAVIPAAGYGTRFLPIAKAIPKEMIPVLDIPTIQYVVEEAAESGITDILIIISRSKRAIEEHFTPNQELESELEFKQKLSELESLQRVSSLARIHYFFQPKMRGLGDAVLHAKTFVGNEPFAVMLGDTLLTSQHPTGRPVLGQLIDVYQQYGSSTTALEEVPLEKVSRYGIAGGTWKSETVYEIDRWIEKPQPEEAPSRLAVASRYVFTPGIFEELEKTKPGKGGEIQLTDAMLSLLSKEPSYGCKILGQRHDIGNKIDFIKTNLLFALRRPELRDELLSYIQELAQNPPSLSIPTNSRKAL